MAGALRDGPQAEQCSDAPSCRLEGSIRTLVGLLTSNQALLQLGAARCLHELSHSEQSAVAEACLPATSYLLTYLSGHSADFIVSPVPSYLVLGLDLKLVLWGPVGAGRRGKEENLFPLMPIDLHTPLISHSPVPRPSRTGVLRLPQPGPKQRFCCPALRSFVCIHWVT